MTEINRLLDVIELLIMAHDQEENMDTPDVTFAEAEEEAQAALIFYKRL